MGRQGENHIYHTIRDIFLQSHAFQIEERHKEIEVHMNNMITKSNEEDDHVKILKKLFDRLCKYQLKLKPTKCTFDLHFFLMNEF
jgi:hypothetical protein